MSKPRPKMTVVDGGRPADADEWKSGFTYNRDGKLEGTLHNLLLILENDERLAGLWWLNESSNQILLSRDPVWNGGSKHEFVDSDTYELTAWLQNPQRYGIRCSDDAVHKAVVTVARRYKRHPIREYLTGLAWDGVPRVETMLIDMFGAADSEYTRRAAQCWMVSAAARVLWHDPRQPSTGAQVDFMLVLEGEQGKRKSSALREICGSEWFVETSESPSGTDFYQVIQGAWIVEIGEMDSFSKADVTSVKTAITRRVDKFRAPYERQPRSYRRECVFAGTTNEHQYLRDPTGGRRFLPVITKGEVRIDLIKEHRDQLWAEAVHLFGEGFEWWQLPADAQEQQAARYVGDSWEGRIEPWLDMRVAPDRYPGRVCGVAGRLDWTTTDEVLTHAIGLDPGKHGKPEQMRVASILKTLGWEQERRRWPGGGRESRWFRIGAIDTWLATESARLAGEAERQQEDPFEPGF